MSELKPCPFCGETPRWCGDDIENKHDCHLIKCDGCGTLFDVDNDIIASGQTMKRLRALVALTWNTRFDINCECSIKCNKPVDNENTKGDV